MLEPPPPPPPHQLFQDLRDIRGWRRTDKILLRMDLVQNPHPPFQKASYGPAVGNCPGLVGMWGVVRIRFPANILLPSSMHPMEDPDQRRLKKRRETVRLSCTKQMGSARSSMRTTHPFHCPPETLIYFDLAVNLVGGANVVCFVTLLINRAIHTTLWSSQISWSSRARRVISYRCALIGEEMRAFHCPIVR